MDELHKESKSIASLLARINGEKIDRRPNSVKPVFFEPVPEPNRSKILGFYRYCVSEDLSKGRIGVLLGNIYRISCWIKHRPFETMNKEDIIDLVEKIKQTKAKNLGMKTLNIGYEEQTVESYKITIRKFWKWLKGTEEYPPEVNWIKRKKKKNGLLPEDIWKPEEVMRLAEVCDNLRDRAFIMGLFASGCRIGEYIRLRRKDVIFDEYGCQLLVNGKTGSRRDRIEYGASELASWLDIHHDKNPEARVWIGVQTKRPVTYEFAQNLLRRLRDKAGIKKKCNPHLFRHSCATFYAPTLTEQVMNAHFGWQQGGRTVAIYTHLSGKQVDDQILAMYGKKKMDNDGKEILQSVKCPRCSLDNSPASRHCHACGLPLRENVAKEALERRKTVDRIMNVATEYPELMAVLEKIIKERRL
jgi:integrase/recombinase XerD